MSEHSLVAKIKMRGGRTIMVYSDAPGDRTEGFDVLLRMCADGPVMDREDIERFQDSHGSGWITSMHFYFHEYFCGQDPMADEWGGRDIDFVRTNDIISISREY